ncbi:MAG: hypothetical protein Roseis2KO_19040 [Roseivirga sp.]
MGIAKDDMKEHGQPNPGKSYLSWHKYREIIELIAKEKQPEGEVQPENPIA